MLEDFEIFCNVRIDNSERVLNLTEKPCPFYKQTWVCTNIYKIDRLVTV